MPSAPTQTVERRHEVAEVNARRIVWTAAILVTTLVVVALAAWGVLALFRSDEASNGLPSVRPLLSRMPAPQLQSAPAGDLSALRVEKQAMLSSYRWLDRRAGVVQIPIDRAMQLMAAGRQTTSHEGKKTPESSR